jgi:hypothetical protein
MLRCALPARFLEVSLNFFHLTDCSLKKPLLSSLDFPGNTDASAQGGGSGKRRVFSVVVPSRFRDAGGGGLRPKENLVGHLYKPAGKARRRACFLGF